MSDISWLALILVGLLAGLISGKFKPAAVFASAAIVSYLLGLVSLEQMFASFTNASLITLVLLLLASLALEKTTILAKLSQHISQSSFTASIAKLGFFTALLSSFTNNTAVVASLIGVVQRNENHPPHKLLLPLSYAAILGGTLTLIGTSTNLIVNSFVEDAGLTPLTFFEFTPIGIVLVFAGGILLMLLAHTLPNRSQSPAALQLPYLLEARISRDSKLIGRSVQQNQLRALKKLYLAELERDGVRISPVPPQWILQAGDRLRFSGDVNSVSLLQQFDGLQWFGQHQAQGQHLVEAVLSPSSNLVGQSLKSSQFREQYDAAVMAIRRGATPLKGGLGDVNLQAGDVLLLTPGSQFQQASQRLHDFAAVTGLGVSLSLSRYRSLWVLIGFAVAIFASMLSGIALAKTLLVLLLVYLLMGAVTLTEMRQRFPLELVIIVGSALNLAHLMISSGLAANITSYLLAQFNHMGVYGAFIGVYLLTLLLTELITNNAAAALAFPIAYSVALHYGVDIKPFILAVVFGASASFISPYGYQTNLMVYHAGSYRFSDFVRLGLPLSVLYSVIVCTLVPQWFPF